MRWPVDHRLETRLDLPRRMRRNRKAEWARRLVRENALSTADLIWPIFIREGEGQSEPIATMPGVMRHTVDQAVREAREAASLGIPALALFPNTPATLRDESGSEALNPV
jgi:porphobilinogen synthase